MHQTFYIEADEEISSVIDRLNKSVSVDNYFVVPKRAIFLQSIVNLKLLKREADKIGKRLVLITQDEIGASMAERSGLEVRATIIEENESREPETLSYLDETQQEFDQDDTEDEILNKKNRLKGVGSSSFHDSAGVVSHAGHKKALPANKTQARKIPVNSVSSVKSSGHLPKNGDIHHRTERNVNGIVAHRAHSNAPLKSVYEKNIDPEKERTLEKMFSSVKAPGKEVMQKEIVVSGVAKKIFAGFIVLCFIIFAGVAGYLFLPSAKIKITPSITSEKVDLTVNGQNNISQVEGNSMPIRVIDKEEKISLSYDVSGTSAGQGKKAHGSVVIYNEFSSEAQTLIATTRIESSDGKMFRLVKNVIVPGSTTIGGQMKPGAIEAQVVADQAGSDFNISASSFTIPGFKGGPKYDKFYAKSVENFIGGSSEGGESPSVVSQKDIDNAKQKTEETLKKQLLDGITQELAENEVALEQAEKISIIKSGTTAKTGDLTNNFEYSAVISVRALIFSEKDVKNIIRQSFGEKQDLKDAKWDVSKVEYGILVADFDKNTLELKIHSEITITPIIDIEKIKGEMLDKKDDQLGSILKNYSSIKGVNVEFEPSFVSRIPQYSSRVSVEIEKTPQ